MPELSYSRHGNHYLPDFILPEQEENTSIGKYGLLYRKHLKTHKKIFYINLLTSGTLHEHLAEIDKQASDRFKLIVRQMAQQQGITESLKATDQMAWVGAMNNIRACAEEIVRKEMIYA